MVWTLEFAGRARKQFRKLDHVEADRILRVFDEISKLDDPFSRGHGLTGPLTGLWRFRVSDWRVIARVEQERLVILVLEVGHRREIYE